MPYLILIFGLLLGLYGLYRFFLVANVHQIKALTMTAFFLVVCIALFFMAITGRLPAALALVAALSPFALAWWKHRHMPPKSAQTPPPAAGPITRAEALDILHKKQAKQSRVL